MNLRGASAARNMLTLLVVAMVASLFLVPSFNVKALASPEYQRYVHTYLNSGDLGNWTYVEKPVFRCKLILLRLALVRTGVLFVRWWLVTAITFTVTARG